MNVFWTLAINGLTQGAVLALVSLGFVVLYRATKVFSLAQGSFMLLGALVCFWCQSWGAGLIGSLVVSALLVGLAAGAVYLLGFSGRASSAEPITVAIATIGLATLIQMICLLIWGAGSRTLADTFSSAAHTFTGGIRINDAEIASVVLAVAVTAFVVVFFRRTRTGLRMEAMADDPRLAVYAGVRVRRLGCLAWTLGGICAALSGMAISFGSGQVDPNAVVALGFVAFPAILLGGLDSVGGSLIGGLLIGLIDSVTAYFLGGSWLAVMPYLCLFATLLVRPTGLFGTRAFGRL